MKKMFLPVLLAAVMCSAGELTVQASADKKDAVYGSGDVATVTATALEDGKPVSGKTVNYVILADGGFSKRGKFVSDAKKPWTFSYRFTYPSALRAEFTILGDDGKRIPLKNGYDQVRFAGGRIGLVCDPLKILPAGKTPEDFDAFWKAQLDRLAQVKMVELERKKLDKLPASFGSVDFWDVKVSCVDGVPVSGYLGIPKKAAPKSLPAVLLVQGAGVGGAVAYRVFDWAKKGAICMDINAHGVLNGQPRKYYDDLKKGKFKNYYSKVYPEREKHIFLNMALRVVRALEYLRSLPEWNGRDLIIRGASQGGWQAVVGAGLDPKVTMCIAGVPGFADFDGEFAPVKRMERMHFGGAIRAMKKGPEETAAMLRTQSYFDPANFAPRLGCETYLSVGYVDLSCPTTSVYSIYNRIPASTKKHIDTFPGGVHAKSPAAKGAAALSELLEKNKKQLSK